MIELKPLTLYEFLSLIISIIGFVTVGITIYFLFRQAKISDRNLKETFIAPLRNQQSELNKLFIDKSYLRKYFYDNEKVDGKKTENYDEIVAVAEYILDFFTTILFQKRTHGNMLTITLWREYMKESFANSPILCSTLEKYSKLYAPELLEIKKEALLPITSRITHQSKKTARSESIREQKVDKLKKRESK